MHHPIRTLLALTALLSPTVLAQDWALGGQYGQASQGGTDFEIVMLSVSHPIQLKNTQWRLTPEFRYGIGVDREPTRLREETQLEHLSVLSLKAEYHFGQAFVYAAPQFGRLETRFDGSGLTQNTEEFGWALGAGWQTSASVGFEASVERLDDNHLLTVSARYQF